MEKMEVVKLFHRRNAQRAYKWERIVFAEGHQHLGILLGIVAY